jgi:hypothetical protein
MLTFLLVTIAALALAQAPPKKPNPSEDFHAKVGAYFHRQHRRDIGEG